MNIENLRDSGDSHEGSVVRLAEEAKAYLLSFKWCKSIKQGYLIYNYIDVFGVFYFEIEPDEADSAVWVIVGDTPPAYMDTQYNSNALEAVESYIYCLKEWVDSVKNDKPLNGLMPVTHRNGHTPLPPSEESLDIIQKRISFIQNHILQDMKERIELFEKGGYLSPYKAMTIEELKNSNIPNQNEIILHADSAKKYMLSFEWCKEIKSEFLVYNYSDVFIVFFFEIIPKNGEKSYWIIVDHASPIYISTYYCKNIYEAVDAHLCNLKDWIDAVYKNQPYADLMPVTHGGNPTPLSPNEQSVKVVQNRILFIENRILPDIKEKFFLYPSSRKTLR